MKSVLPLLLIGFFLHSASTDTHSLKYFYTAVSGDVHFPEFTIVGLVDGVQFMYYDSDMKRVVPKTEWIKEKEGADYWESQTQIATGEQLSFKNNIQIAKERFNQTKSTGVHTYQNMYGCEWDDETGETNGFDQYGYDGKDFLSLDLKNMRYISTAQQALISVQRWNGDRALLENDRQYYTQICTEWLKKYVQYGKSSLERTVSPEVSVLQKGSSSPVECRATGFYPKEVMMSWQKDGQDLNEDVELAETLPNEDGTFQKSSRLTVSTKELAEHQYSCVVDHKSLPERIVKTWDAADNTSIIIGIVVAVIVLVAVIAGVGLFMRKKSKSGPNYGKTSTADSDSDNSGTPVQNA
ncbi:patr class I histocompatibility antigen, B-1 alpha chain [Chanos chanos]|uniref:Patr class I histocompatibility antigen, B-1 alpha chain n=1 Tax=Chanos chanos TaxID=29144 RepID=A0A6J2UTU4_CHACN|nr:patr class I histocompatibility antigen, B-1 alpha chain-like [Chanos chanos]